MGIRHRNASTDLFSHLTESCHQMALPIPHNFYFQATRGPCIIMGVHEHCKQREWNDGLIRLSSTASHLCNTAFNLSR
ncbi:hypothetical protein K443DRAFT_255772 [Laccaria amethystina LaAM-08-1]|uniref:Unplaced genomic scaffold K443scaffold_162, whole genome shotgun sequence n=1 Tax=Laccaria amethystina LaAM-08-1 TaxID=1095629 RepID=A0A0C9WLJ5_9AGAR|nr:hypothetical protein K443DRAFT_255772 [Laccaria amethystina LaAM-08-1]